MKTTLWATISAWLRFQAEERVRHYGLVARNSERDLYPPVTVPESESGPIQVPTCAETQSQGTLTQEDVTLRA
ncbi:hypothetical protein MLP_46530 [Microlunatus phosphovorus NM-1]|uniref:Uncharacterized protein n=1 Tax=Microlunatus phosphovorus (strain ATCC 700054 / DSM 10555 / JCM 9379 / NBRC 101784 / NCIMB 13414 / VKM Ac-1990 / NM-1) TaxID=1032480 RepID=F5XEB9_MICPN|nr:hypothetical protein [Microlunatus phosphovorus]BAK37667.1 hypothetical protein MLP_46530 [Microlunatus phosphovorus NM-1]